MPTTTRKRSTTTTGMGAATTAVSYVRLSPRPDGAYDLGLDRQREQIERVANARKLAIVREYADEDRSAFKGKRAGYEDMMLALRSGEVRAVVAYDLDRMYRQPRELEDLIDLAESGVLVVTAQGDIDLSTSNGRLVARMVVNVASKSSEDESRRMKLKHEQLAKHGQPAGGKRPFGFKADRVAIDAREAKLIRDAAARVLAGGSLRSIVSEWNAKGITTANGTPWRQFTLKWVLTSPRIAGLRAHRGEVVGKATWKSILSEGDFYRVKALLTDPARTPANSSGARKYLLTGIARCGLCGGEVGTKLVARPSGSGVRSMVCAKDFGGCGKIRTLAEPFEELAAEFVFAAVNEQAFMDAMGRRDNTSPDELVASLAADEVALEQLARDHYAESIISRAEYLAARDAVVARRDATAARLGELAQAQGADSLAGEGESLRAAWKGMSFDAKRSTIAAVIDHIKVHPAVKGRNIFDPDRFEPVWRHSTRD